MNPLLFISWKESENVVVLTKCQGNEKYFGKDKGYTFDEIIFRCKIWYVNRFEKILKVLY